MRAALVADEAVEALQTPHDALGRAADGKMKDYDAAFARLKKSGLGRRLRDLDSFESICYRQCAYAFEGCDYYSFPEVYEAVSAEDVRAFLFETVRPEQMAVSIIYPKGEAE